MRFRSHLAHYLACLAICAAPATMAQVSPVSFQALVSYPAGAGPYAVAVGDFNKDGRTDLAVANHNANSVSIFLGNGDGTFQNAVGYPAGVSPSAITVGDFNGDGNADLAVANGPSNSVSVLLGNGDGTFQAAVSYAAGATPVSLAVGDFNGDGKLDLAAADEAGNKVAVLLGNGNGTFAAPVAYSVGSYPYSVAVGDFNADGKPDLAVVNNGGNSVSVLLGNGDGTFQAAVGYAVKLQPVSVAIADFNGDGKLDLAVANQGSYNVSILLGNGDGTFQAAFNRGAGFNPSSVVAADFNGDNKADLAVANLSDNTVSVLLGHGDGTFQTQVTFPAGSRPIAIAAGSFDGNARSDLALADNGSGNAGVLISKAGTTTTLTSTPNPAFVTQMVTFTATVSGQYGGTPTGSVTFNKGTTALATVPLSAGTATFQTSALPTGNFNVKAVYGGDTNFGGSNSALLSQTVQKVATVTTIVSSLNPASKGQAVTFTAKVSSSFGTPPDGEIITFKHGTNILATVPLSGGSAAFTTSSLPAGSIWISASYAADAEFMASSANVNETINAIGTSITLTSSLNPSLYGQAVSFTANVSSAAGTPPDGETVSFLDSGLPIGHATLSGGIATLTIGGLVPGTHPITASYPGDSNLAAATSSSLKQSVTKAPSTTVVGSSANPSNLGAPVIFTATVTSSTGAVPSGYVTFKDGAVTLATVAVSSSGTATYSSSALPGGAHSISAVFAATPDLQPSTSAPLVQNVYIPGGVNFSHASHVGLGFYSGNTATANVTINPGDTVLVVIAAGGYTFPNVASVVDNGGNTGYAQLVKNNFGDVAQLFVWGALNVSNSATTLTISFDHVMPSIGVDVVTYTGVASFGNIVRSTGSWNPSVTVTTQKPNDVAVMGVSQNVPGLTSFSSNIGGVRDFDSFVSASLVGSLAFGVSDNSATTAGLVTNKVTSSNPGDWAAAGIELVGP